MYENSFGPLLCTLKKVSEISAYKCTPSQGVHESWIRSMITIKKKWYMPADIYTYYKVQGAWKLNKN